MLAISPEGEYAPPAAVVVVQIRYGCGERDRRAAARRVILQCCHVDLFLRVILPQGWIRPVDEPFVRDDPLPVEGPEAVPDRCDDILAVLRHGLGPKLMPVQSVPQRFVQVSVPILMRVEQGFLRGVVAFRL